MRKLTTEQFITRAVKIHNNRYDYSLVKYEKGNTDVNIICSKHGVFKQRPDKHLNGHGCHKCRYETTRKKNTKTIKYFIEKAVKKHGNRYNYSLVEYKNAKLKVKIICNECNNVFEQRPNDHASGYGCPKCVKKYSPTTKEFLEKVTNIHNDKYNYSLVNYKNNYTKIKIICHVHGIFEQTPNNHLNGHGCPKCKSSKGEEKIREYLKQNNILFEMQKTFEDCRGKVRPLMFDFYLPNHNILIEYDGEQHFRPFRFLNEEKELFKFKQTQQNDKIKNKYAKLKNIELLRIPYTEFNNIEAILTYNLRSN